MEKVWCGSRSKAMKGANTLFAQDGRSNAIIYTRADILHKNETDEILHFVTYWKSIRKKPEKTNEIPTAQALIKELGLPEGSVYTLDAVHCQKKHLKRLKKLSKLCLRML